MSSAIVTLLLLIVTLLIIGSFVYSAWRAHQSHMREIGANQEELSSTTGQMLLVVQLMDGSMVGLDRTGPLNTSRHLPKVVPSAHLPHHWYNRRRSIVSLGLFAMLAIGLLIQTGVAGDAFHSLTSGLTLTGSQISGLSFQTALRSAPASASSRIIRVDSALRNQYYTDYQYQVWSYSSCSGISLEEVMNSYGHNFVASDVLQVESDMGIWDTYDGLTGGEPGMAKAADHFGFSASAHPPRTLQDLILTANKGFPVIIGSLGHIMVVKGGDANFVYVVDSSPANRQVMTHDQFMNFWDGFSVLITPKP